MSNDNTPENKDLDPVVQAVVNALNDRSKFQPSYIKQNLAEQTQVEEGVMDFDNNTIVVDIYEEDGKIVGIDNGVIFSNDDLPGVDYLEAYYGTEYVEDMINEAISSIELSEATKPVAKPKPAAKPAAKPVAKPKPAAKPAPAKPAPAKPAPAKPAPAKPAAGKKPTTGNTKVTPAKGTGKKPTTGNTKVTPAKGTASKTPPSDGLQPVTVTGKRSASKTPPSDGLQPVTVTGRRSASQTPPGGGDAPADGEQKPGFLSKVGNFFNNTEVGQGLKKVAGDALIGGIGSKLTGGSFSQGAKAGAVGSLVGQTGKAAYDDITGRDDEGEGETQASQTPRQNGRTGSGSGASGSVPVRYSIDGRQVEKDEYQSQRGDLDQDVVFNVKSKAGRRSIKAGDPEYQTYMDRYKKMRSVVQEALIRMGAVLTEEGWMLNDELLESVYTECDLGNIESPYFYDATGRLRIMTESEWVNLSLAEAVVERLIAESMDEVGEEDEDVDNDGDSDSSDDYLSKRRKAIGDAIKAKGKK